MSVDMDLIKKLRNMTKAPIKDVKEALIETDGDIDDAKEYLRKKGANEADEKSDRETEEGVSKVQKYDDKVVGVQIACETDFVAKNDTFNELVNEILDLLNEKAGKFESKDDLDEGIIEEIEKKLKDNFMKIGENMQFMDAFAKQIEDDVKIYRHPGNKIVSVVFYDGDEKTAKEIGLQIAAMNPDYQTREDIPSDVIDDIKEEFREEMEDEDKPKDIMDKIIKGKLDKRLSQIVLVEQDYIRDDSKQIKDIMDDDFELQEFVRYSI